MPDAAAPAVPFVLPDPALEPLEWEHNEHLPRSTTPLAMETGLGRPRPGGGVPSSIYVNGYSYYRAGGGGMGDPSRDPAALAASRDSVATWREVWLPQIEEFVAKLEQFDPTSVEPGTWEARIAEQGRDFTRVFVGVHRVTVVPAQSCAGAFIEAYVARFGEARRDDALALLEGYANASSERASALWALGRMAAADAALLGALEAARTRGDDPLAADGVGEPFRARWRAMLDRFGFTTRDHLEDLPTWSEDPSEPLGTVIQFARSGPERDPVGALPAQAARRERLEAELRARAAADGTLAPMLDLLGVAQYLVPATEDHNLLCDQRMIAASRTRWLRIGAHLLDRRLVAAPDDVFYHRLDELLAALERGEALAAEEIAARRERQVRWRSVSPPARLGGEPLPHATNEAAASPIELRGLAAARGRYTGRARVIATLAEASTLEPGDVLVTTATTPEWTPHFAVIGALVTDAGGVLTHAAIVAREFGIPAVVGAIRATQQIPDGATVTVDGGAGTVTIAASDGR